MTDFEAIKKMSESKAMNGRFGKSNDASGLAIGRRVRTMGRWKIKHSDHSKKSRPAFNWAKNLAPK